MANTNTSATIQERVRKPSPITASEDEHDNIVRLFESLNIDKGAHALDSRIYKLIGPQGESVELPESVLALLQRMIEILQRGDAVTLAPVHKELTTQQAADILNVSRQYMVRLLEQGKLPHTKTGTHRRVRLDDLMRFKATRDAARLEGLDQLSALSQEYGGYEEMP